MRATRKSAVLSKMFLQIADMPKTHSIEYLLESLVEGESLDGVLTSLIVIAEKKAANQWSRAARRLKKLREWCAKFGPDSDCR